MSKFLFIPIIIIVLIGSIAYGEIPEDWNSYTSISGFTISIPPDDWEISSDSETGMTITSSTGIEILIVTYPNPLGIPLSEGDTERLMKLVAKETGVILSGSMEKFDDKFYIWNGAKNNKMVTIRSASNSEKELCQVIVYPTLKPGAINALTANGIAHTIEY